MTKRNQRRTVLAVVAVAAALFALSASADVLVYEPFAYPDGWLNGQGGALGTTGTWATTDTGESNGWRVHQEGDLSGVYVAVGTANVFDGTVDNLVTSGGYVGLAGPEDRGLPPGTDSGTGNLDASIALDPSVTATFTSGTTTWFSFVSVHGWDRNQGAPQFMIGTDTTTGGSRGLTMVNSGNGIGGGGGPPRRNLQDTYPQFFRDGVNNHTPGGYQNDSGTNGGGTFGLHDGIQLAFGSGNDNTASGTLDEWGQPRTQTMQWVRNNPDGSFGAVNIVVGKIEWDADTGGEDIISVVRFLETDTLDEAAFDAQIALLPALSSRNWASNKPNLDQSLFDTLNFSSLKYFVDEIRIATTFEEAVGLGGRSPSVDVGPDMITWSGEPVELDPNVVNNDPCFPQADLTYLWSADDPCAVFYPSADVNDPNVTITKPAFISDEVTIVNHSFEDPVLGDGSYTSTPPAWTDGSYDVTAPNVWVVGDSDSGVYNPTAADGYGGVAPDGNNVMFAISGVGYDKGMNQVLSATLQANTQYDLSALVGNPFLFNGSTTTADYRIELLAGGVVLESDTGPSPLDDTTWTTASLTHTSGADAVADPNVGQPLEIRLLAVDFDGKEVDFDDVKLTAESPTPDPYVVELTLVVNGEGFESYEARGDKMTIDVYDDACQMARLGEGKAADNPGDFDGNCITDFKDFAEMATKWLTDISLTEPVEQ